MKPQAAAKLAPAYKDAVVIALRDLSIDPKHTATRDMLITVAHLVEQSSHEQFVAAMIATKKGGR